MTPFDAAHNQAAHHVYNYPATAPVEMITKAIHAYEAQVDRDRKDAPALAIVDLIDSLLYLGIEIDLIRVAFNYTIARKTKDAEQAQEA